MVLTPRERIPYLAITDRPKLRLPDGVRLIVWVIVNVENWDARRAMPRAVLPPPMGVPLLPDIPNWSENLLFAVYDPDADVTMWLHLGTVPGKWTM